MNAIQKEIIERLLAGCYLRKAKNHAGDDIVKLYTGKQQPVTYYPAKQYVSLRKRYDVFKVDATGKIELSLKAIRAMHGRCWIKKTYKNKRFTKVEF